MMGTIELFSLVFFHLLIHALFKALLLMCVAGGVIHYMGDSKDIRFMGSSSLCIPFTSSCLMVSNFAVCGMPLLAGFCSRDFMWQILSMRYVNMCGKRQRTAH